MKRNRKGSVCIVLGTLLLLAALGLTAYNRLDSRRAGRVSAEAAQQLQAVLPEPAATPDDAPAGEMLIPDYILDPNREMPEREIDGEAYVAMLEIPSLELELPVLSHWSYDGLRIAPCRYSGSLYLNNLVIAGHNYTTHFAPLWSMRPGDAVIVTDMDGSRFRFVAAEIHTLSPDQVREMTESEWDLTLFTCTADGSLRFAVCCISESES